MFQASITNKEILGDGRANITVEFSDGVKTITQTVIPQDADGLNYFIQGRLKELNFAATDLPTGVFTPPSTPVPVIDPAVQARIDWFNKLNQYYRIKLNLLDTQILTGNETEITSLVKDIKSTYNADYINFI